MELEAIFEVEKRLQASNYYNRLRHTMARSYVALAQDVTALYNGLAPKRQEPLHIPSGDLECHPDTPTLPDSSYTTQPMTELTGEYWSYD